MADELDTITAPLLGADAHRYENTEALRAEVSRLQKRCQDLDFFIERAADRVKQDGAVVLVIRGARYRLEPESQ